MKILTRRAAVAAPLLLLAAGAAAHTGHVTDGLQAGLLHPFGLDHLLAMVAVGLWSAVAFEGSRRWLGPLTFLTAMALGAALGIAGLMPPGLEAGITVSVMMFGAMLAFARRLPVQAGLPLVAAAALLHGLAHGAELPAGAPVLAYGAGLLATTALLHLGGLGIGARLCTALPPWRHALAALFGLAGLTLLLRL